MDENDSETPAAQAPPPSPAPATLRVAAAWGLGLISTLALSVVAAASGVALTVFGLGGVVLATTAALVLAGATIWRRGMLPLAVLGLALALPAAWAASANQRLDRSYGPLLVEPVSPADLSDSTYRRGVGPVLIDLRGFRAAMGSTTQIQARADAGRLAVALPRDRCFNLRVRFHNDVVGGPSSFVLRTIHAATGDDETTNVSFGSMGFTMKASAADSARSGRAALAAFDAGRTTTPYGLLAFNRWADEAGRYERGATGRPDAPTLQLDLRSSQQIVIRDYPPDIDPLAVAFSETTGLPAVGIAWPEGLPKPLAPVEQGPSGRSAVRTPRNRARWIAWEHRMIGWAKAQAQRAAGSCASTDDLRSRGVSFYTQPEAVRESGRTVRLLGSPPHQRSAISQRTVDSPDTMLRVEVNGLGVARLLGVTPGIGNRDLQVSP